MRMWVLVLLPVVYAAAVLETALGSVVRVGHVTPDLMALVAVIWLLLASGRWTFLAAGLVGLGADLIAPGRVGLGMACFLLVGYALTRLRARFTLDHLICQVPTVFAAVTLLSASVAVGRWLLGETSVAPSTLLPRAVGVGLYTAGVSLPVLMILGWLREPLQARSKKLAQL